MSLSIQEVVTQAPGHILKGTRWLCVRHLLYRTLLIITSNFVASKNLCCKCSSCDDAPRQRKVTIVGKNGILCLSPSSFISNYGSSSFKDPIFFLPPFFIVPYAWRPFLALSSSDWILHGCRVPLFFWQIPQPHLSLLHNLSIWWNVLYITIKRLHS